MERIALPVSKSLYIRKLIADFLYKMYFDAVSEDVPSDVRVTYDCLVAVSKHIGGEEFIEVNVRDCGAACRFLMAVLAVTEGSWFLTGTERLLQRPMDELADVLVSVGADITTAGKGWLIKGKILHAEQLTVDCSSSSQFASALLLIGDRIGLKSLNVLPADCPSASYVDMTLALLQNPLSVCDANAADWSAALYWYAKLYLQRQGSFLLEKLDLSSPQPDIRIADWFVRWGVESRQVQGGVEILFSGRQTAVNDVECLNVSQNIDTVPIMACMACLQKKTFVFEGVANLSLKESDRLHLLRHNLKRFADIEVMEFNGMSDNCLIIKPKSMPSKKDMLAFDACNDHRLVMAFTLFALFARVSIKGVDCVSKSYPHFKAEAINAGVNMIG